MTRFLAYFITAIALHSIVVQLGELAVPAVLGMDPPSATTLADPAAYSKYTSRQPVGSHIGSLVIHLLGGLTAMFVAATGRLPPAWVLALAGGTALASVGLGALRPGAPTWLRLLEPLSAAAGVYVGARWIEATRRRVRGDR